MKNKTFLIEILIGAPGSGKSTYSEKRVREDKNCVVVSRDAFRKMLKTSYGLMPEKVENMVTRMQYDALKVAMNSKSNIIVDNTHCNMHVIKELVDHILKFDRHNLYNIRIIPFDPTLKELKLRNTTRPEEKRVPEQVIERMFKNLQVVLSADNRKILKTYETGEYRLTPVVYNPSEDLPEAIIVDIDGTVAEMNDKRGPFDWAKVDRDDPKLEIIRLVYLLESKYNVIFMSGRSEDARALTELWLAAYLPGIKYVGLYMRGSHDFRKDSIVKKELFEKHIRDKFNIKYALDDRNQVVDMWRNELGLTVLQVQDGDF